MVGTVVLGRPKFRGREVEVRTIRGIKPDVLVAIAIPGGACYEGEPQRSDWSMGFHPRPPGEDNGVVLDAVCRVANLSQAQATASSCVLGHTA